MTVGAVLPLVLTALAGLEAAARQDTADAATSAYQVAGVDVIHRATAPGDLVAVRLYLLGGTRQTDAAHAGIEALLLRAAAIDGRRAAARTGAITVLEPDVDWTLTGFDVLTEDLEPAWDALAGWVTGPAGGSLSDAGIARARDEMSSAARRRYSQPDSRLHALARQVLFADHPYGIDPEGTVAWTPLHADRSCPADHPSGWNHAGTRGNAHSGLGSEPGSHRDGIPCLRRHDTRRLYRNLRRRQRHGVRKRPAVSRRRSGA